MVRKILRPRTELKEGESTLTFREAPSASALGEYAYAYRKAAARLAGDSPDGGTWEMPIICLYRHAVELVIKAILIRFGPGVGVCPRCVLQRSHGLKDQLEDLMAVADRFDLELSPQLAELIEVWDNEDPMGMKARYPVSKKGKPNELENAKAFDLEAAVADFESVLDELTNLQTTQDWQEYRDIEDGIEPPDSQSS
jgi:hypothetical protein